MKKHSLGKKLLLAGSILTLAVACQSKPVHQPIKPAQPTQSEIDEQGEEEEGESSWDQTEPFKTEEKQLKAATAPAPVESVKETPKTVAVPAEKPAAPVVETPAPTPPPAPVVETKAPEAAPVETRAPVAEVKAPAAPEAAAPLEKPIATPVAVPAPAPIVPEKTAVSENLPVKAAP